MSDGEERARGRKILDLVRVAVKQLLAVSSRNIEERKETEDIMYDTSAELDHFCLVMEQLFLFGLKESTSFFAAGKLREWWGFIRGLARMDKMAANTIDTVLNISSVKTPEGRGRAWIRVALIEKKLAEYIHKLSMSQKVAEYYERWSVFRDSELSQMLLGVLELLSVINFSLCLKDFDFDNISIDQTLSSLQTTSMATNNKRDMQFQSILSGFEETQKMFQSSEQLSKEKVVQLLNTMEKLKEEVKKQGEENDQLETTVEAMKVQRAEGQAELKKVKREKDNLEREMNNEMEELKAQLEAKKAVQSQLSSLVKGHTETITKLNQELKEAKNSSGSLLSRLGGGNDRSAIDIVESLVEEHKKEIDTLKSSHQKQISEMERKIELDIAATKAEKDKEIIDLLKTRPAGDPSQAENLAKLKAEKLNLERQVFRLEREKLHDEEKGSEQREMEGEREEILEIKQQMIEKEKEWEKEREEWKKERERERENNKERETQNKQEIASALKEKEKSSRLQNRVDELEQTLELKNQKYKASKNEVLVLQKNNEELEKQILEKSRMKESLEKEWREKEREREREKEKEAERETGREEERKKNEEESEKIKKMVEEEKKKTEEEKKKREEDNSHHLSLISSERQLNSELTSEKQSLQQKITSLEREIMEKEDEIQTIQGKNDRSKEELSAMTEKNKELNDLCADLRKKIRQNEREGGELKSKMAQLETKAQMAKQNSDLNVSRLEEQLNQREETIVKLTSEKTQLEECISSLEGASQIQDSKKEEIQNKTAHLEQLQAKTLSQERSLSEQKSEITKKTVQIEKFTLSLEEKMKKINELQDEGEQQKEEREREKEKIEGLESEIKRREGEQEEMEKKLKRKEEEIKDLYSAQNTLQNERNELRAEILKTKEELKEEKSQNNENTTKWENMNNSLSSSLKEAQTTLQEVENQKNNFKTTISTLETQNKESSEEIKKQKRISEDLQTKLSEIQDGKQKLSEKLSTLESKITTKKDKIKLLEEKNTQLKDSLSRKETELEQEKETALKQEKEKEALEEENKKNIDKIAQLSSDLSTNTSLLSENQQKSDNTTKEMKKKIGSLQKDLELEKKMAEVRTNDLEQKSSDYDALQKKNSDLASKNNSLVEELTSLKEGTEKAGKEGEDKERDLRERLKEKEEENQQNEEKIKKYQLQIEKLEQILKEKREATKEMNETVDSLRDLVEKQKESLRSGNIENFAALQELELMDMKQQIQMYKKANKHEINQEIQQLLSKMSENGEKLKELRKEIESVEDRRNEVQQLLQKEVEAILRSSPDNLEKWKKIMILCKENFLVVEKEESQKKDFIELKHENEELREELLALKSVIKEQSFTLSQEKEKNSGSKKLHEEVTRLSTELEKADKINQEKTEQLALMQQIKEENDDLQQRGSAKEAAMRSLAVEHDQLEEEHRQQTSYIEQLKGKIAKNAKTIKQLSLSVHAMGLQLQKGQETERELEELKRQMTGLMKTIDKVAEISPQVAIEATGATGFQPNSVKLDKIEISDSNVASYIEQIERDKRFVEDQLADVQLKYLGLCRLVGDGTTKEEDVSELDAAYNFQMRVEKVRKKERELMQEVHIMAEKEAALTESLKASQLSLRQLKGNLESNTRKTDRLKDQMVQLMNENRRYQPTTVKFNEDSDEEEIPQVERKGNDQTVLREWLKDEDVTHCLGCNAAFGLLTRKHHCRHCGRIFCGACSSHQFILPKIHKTQAQRICDDCCTVLSTIDGPSKVK